VVVSMAKCAPSAYAWLLEGIPALALPSPPRPSAWKADSARYGRVFIWRLLYAAHFQRGALLVQIACVRPAVREWRCSKTGRAGGGGASVGGPLTPQACNGSARGAFAAMPLKASH